MLRGVGFELHNLDWNFRPNPDPTEERLAVSLHGFDARCNNCLHQWHADEAMQATPGHFHSLVGWIAITCPNCRQEETMPYPQPPEH